VTVEPTVPAGSKRPAVSSSAPTFGAYPQLVIVTRLIGKAFRALTGRTGK